MTEEEEAEFEREHGVPVNAGTSVIISSWGMALGILFAAIAFATFVLSYFYLRLENPVWPPPDFAMPGFTWTLVAGALAVTSALSARAALRAVRSGDQDGFIRRLTVALLLAAGAVAIQWVDVSGYGADTSTHAYGSIFATLAGYCVALLGGAIIMGGSALYWAIRGRYTVKRYAMVANISRYWIAAAVMWVMGFATLYLGPYLT